MDGPRVDVWSLLGDWLLEASVLVSVFPVIDQMVSERPIRWSIIAVGQAFALLALVSGLYSKSRRR